jgi:hypothetical protein
MEGSNSGNLIRGTLLVFFGLLPSEAPLPSVKQHPASYLLPPPLTQAPLIMHDTSSRAELAQPFLEVH